VEFVNISFRLHILCWCNDGFTKFTGGHLERLCTKCWWDIHLFILMIRCWLVGR